MWLLEANKSSLQKMVLVLKIVSSYNRPRTIPFSTSCYVKSFLHQNHQSWTRELDKQRNNFILFVEGCER